MRSRLSRDFERFARALPADFPDHVRGAYRIDLSARYLGAPIAHPFGKGSGQLSLKLEQLEADAAAGLAFAVLKTVVAEDAAGTRTMGAWAIHETRMRVERRRAATGREGWTVTWKGRGWDGTFEEYLTLVREARALAASMGGRTLFVPSVKYHLPRLGEDFRRDEYTHTTRRLAEAWGSGVLLLEKDFSPTLAGDPLADERPRILRWIREVPARVREAGVPLRLALKLMNARFDDAFQAEMLAASRDADAVVAFNRLWDDTAGVAFGGYDLSDRNLRALDLARASAISHPPIAATGNICSGRMMLDYALRGAECGQLHTFLQLPLGAYPATAGSRTQRALHALVFHPEDGLLAALLDLEAAGRLERRDGMLHFLDLPTAAASTP